ncbi:MAG: trypsin-like peptidase domain-containing protein, partial [Eggerthellaceae bacterium]|nr:trypsin-like peptidase domain-containing protein [Eggerthellaceae bacterium]
SVKVAKKGGGVKTFFTAFAGAACACLLAFGGWGLFNSMDDSKKDKGDSAPVVNSKDEEKGSNNIVISGNEDPTLAEAVAQKCLPSVVAIDVYATQSNMYGMYGYGFGYGGNEGGELVQSSLGSGVVLTQDGYIITNYHVIEGGEAFVVTIEGEQYDAEVVGSDPSSDVAVLKAVDAKGLTPMEIGDSDNLIIGEWVMTLGSPFGLEQSVATGIVSATSRSQIMEASVDMYGQSTGETTIYPNMIQTDAAINPGNSGGALVDAEGRLIGINTLITSYSGNYSGVGFAIPVNYAYSLAQQIIDGGQPTHAQLGVSLSTVNSSIAQRYGLSADEGAYIASVFPGTGAAEAGLQEGDIVIAFDGEAVTSASDLMLDVRTKREGDTVTLTVDRNGEVLEVPVTLGSDANTLQEEPQTQQNGFNGGSDSRLDDLFNLYHYFFGDRGYEREEAA